MGKILIRVLILTLFVCAAASTSYADDLGISESMGWAGAKAEAHLRHDLFAPSYDESISQTGEEGVPPFLANTDGEGNPMWDWQGLNFHILESEDNLGVLDGTAEVSDANVDYELDLDYYDIAYYEAEEGEVSGADGFYVNPSNTYTSSARIGDYDLRADIKPYEFHGYTAAKNFQVYDPDNVDPLRRNRDTFLWRSGGFMRDEILVDTVDGSSVSMELDFQVDVKMRVQENDFNQGDVMTSKLTWASPTDDFYPGTSMRIFKNLDYLELFILENDMGEFEAYRLDSSYDRDDATPLSLIDMGGGYYELVFSELVTFSTLSGLDSTHDGLISDGSLLPMSLSQWGEVTNGIINWQNTITMTDVRLFNESGALLNPSQYSLMSNNPTYFPGASSSAPVPEPGMMSLMAMGVIGYFFKRKHY